MKGWKKSGAWVNSPQADEVAAFYGEGHSVRETAERFGVTLDQVNNAARVRQISNGKNVTRGLQASNELRRAEAEKHLAEKLHEFGLEYLGGYTARGSKVRVKCLKCGCEYERTVEFLKKGTAPACAECQKLETKKRQEEQRRKKAQQAEVKALEREWYRRFHPPKDSYSKMHEAFLNRSGICEICGKPYTVREYVESCGRKKAQDNGVCSEKCRRIKLNREGRESRKRRGVQDNHRHRAKKNGGEYDPSVTLKRLVERDGLRCAICGEMCDWNDHSWSKYSGPMYPSIDHIIPMSKGGGHTWDNVQVAHIMCNSLKGVTA